MTSSAIAKVEYRTINGVPSLDVEFRSGSTYRYFDLPSSLFNELANAESKGRYFQDNIRGQFKFEKLKTE